MRIRRATRDDIPAIVEVGVQAWHWAYTDILPAEVIADRTNVAFRIERLQDRYRDDRLMLVAVDDSEKVIGFASENRPAQVPGIDAEIGALYVTPNATRHGVGRALVKAMVAEFRLAGCRSMVIQTLEQNAIGCGFYRKLGGRLHSKSDWNGIPAVFFVWDDMGILEA